jgi:hypothetical protein
VDIADVPLQRDWDELPSAERARLKARQGVTYPVLEGLTVADPESLAMVPTDAPNKIDEGRKKERPSRVKAQRRPL